MMPTSIRCRTACIWIAVAALAIAYAARAQAGIEHARTYTGPVIEFLVGHQAAADASSAQAHDAFRPGSLRLLQDSGSPVWTPVLPVLFIGLLFPLALGSPHGSRHPRRILSEPSLPSAFQRPPPSRIA